MINVPYSGKRMAGRMLHELTLFKRLVKKLWRINRSAKGLLIVATNLNGFSLANRLQVCQTFYPPKFTAIQYILVYKLHYY